MRWNNCLTWGLWQWLTRRGALWAQPSATGGWWCHICWSPDMVTWWEFAASDELRVWWMAQPLLRWMPPLLYPGRVQRAVISVKPKE